jgi:16S rRNA (cytidine1402-2'-O)-methyltransferase
MTIGTLYIVATPIGNLEDITLRALRILKEADLIAAEDTRHSRKLLSHFGISRPLTSYYDHNQTLKGERILKRLAEGACVALITDAGTPCISDPGYQLVRDAVVAGIPVVPIPGPCAAITALSASGLPSDAFTFAGFLPQRQGKRRERLEQLRNEPRVLILYEAPQRLAAALTDIGEVCGDREVVVVREMTKIYEEFVRGKARDLAAQFSGEPVKGEVVLLVSPAPVVDADDRPALPELLARLLAGGHTLKDAVSEAARECGVSRSKAYAAALVLKESGAAAVAGRKGDAWKS